MTPVYWLLGAYFAALAWRGARDAGNPRRITTAGFWALLSVLLFAAERMPPRAVGVCVVVLVLIAGFGGLRTGRYAIQLHSRRSPSELALAAAREELDTFLAARLGGC